jgi:hypothetical protein
MCAQLAGESGAGMFTTGLSADGTIPASHYISVGMIEDTFAYVMSDPAIMYQVCIDAGMNVTLAQCEYILSICDISDEQAQVALDRLGLQLVQETL